jgi:hypothetical protein
MSRKLGRVRSSKDLFEALDASVLLALASRVFGTKLAAGAPSEDHDSWRTDNQAEMYSTFKNEGSWLAARMGDDEFQTALNRLSDSTLKKLGKPLLEFMIIRLGGKIDDCSSKPTLVVRLNDSKNSVA